MITILHYENGIIRKIAEEQVKPILAGGQGFIWVDLAEPTYEEEQWVLGELVAVNPAVVEEMRRVRGVRNPIPRLDDYIDYLFVIFAGLELEDQSSGSGPGEFSFRSSPLCGVIFKQVLITHHSASVPSIRYAREICEKNPPVFGKGPAHLFFLIIDNVIDNYVPVLACIGKLMEGYEEEVFQVQEKKYMEKILRFRKNIIAIRRITYYERELLQRLAHGELVLVQDTDKRFYHSVFEHISRLAEGVDSFRDSAAGLIDAHLSLNSQNLNEVMKMLTITSTIFLPLSVITGFYGMNLAVLPGASSPYSFIPVTLFMAAVAGVMLYVFKKRRWL